MPPRVRDWIVHEVLLPQTTLRCISRWSPQVDLGTLNRLAVCELRRTLEVPGGLEHALFSRLHQNHQEVHACLLFPVLPYMIWASAFLLVIWVVIMRALRNSQEECWLIDQAP